MAIAPDARVSSDGAQPETRMMRALGSLARMLRQAVAPFKIGTILVVSLNSFQARTNYADDIVLEATNHVRQRRSYTTLVICDQDAHNRSGRKLVDGATEFANVEWFREHEVDVHALVGGAHFGRQVRR